MGMLDSKIVQVTVYPDRARVLRRGSTELEAGRHVLEIPELPLLLDPDSVRAAVRGSAGARLLGVSVERTYFRESPAERVRALEAEIQSLEDEDAGRKSRQAVIEGQLAFLDALAEETEPLARGLAFGRTQVSDLAALLDYIGQRKTKLMTDLQEIGIARRESGKTLEKLRQELEHLRGARPRQRHVAKIDLEVLEPGHFEADLIYTLTQASWQPLYDLRLWEAREQAEEPSLEMTYLGQVQQKTGEDWIDVELILSTARPALSGALPELTPWYLSVLAPRPAVAPAPARMKAAAPAMEMDDMFVGAEPEEVRAEPLVEAAAAVAVVDTSGAAVTFRIAARGDIPSDGEPHKTTIAIYSLVPELDYLCVPKLADVAHRRAETTNTTGAAFLSGPANVFAGDEFIGLTTLEHIAPGETFELALGVDDRIKVKREMVAREVDKSLIGDRRRLHYGYEIEVENLRPAAESVTVQDQYPLSRHEQIKVKLTSAAPEPTSETEMHELEWKLELAAGQKQVIRFDYGVEHPRSLTVTGLPD